MLSPNARSSTPFWSSLALLTILLHTAVAESFANAQLQNLSDGETLMRFKDNAVDIRHELETWVSGTSFCDSGGLVAGWRGVTCKPSNSSSTDLSIHTLDLHELHLSGSPSSTSYLGDIASLDTLDLSDNSFSGEIPDSFSSLYNLRVLRLQRNLFNGTIPHLPAKLRRLSLQENDLSGNITNLMNLRDPIEVDIHGNNLTGKLLSASAFQWIDSLLVLDVSNNRLSGSIPSALAIAGARGSGGELRGYYMNFSFNRFAGEIPQGPWRVESLDFSNNQLYGSIPEGVLHNNVTSHLNCSSNFLSGSLSHNLEGRTFWPGGLKTLDVSDNRFDSSIPEVLLSTSEQKLSILDTLEILNLQRNHFEGNIDHLLSAKFVKLKELRLSGNNFTVEGTGLDQISNVTLPALEVLDLSRNRLQGVIPDGLSDMPNLKEIRLGGNSISGVISATQFSSWNNLEVLDVRNNLLRWSDIDHSSNRSALQTMFDSHVMLKELRIGSNNLSRSVLPVSSSKLLHSMEILDLSNSNLAGTISAELFNDRYLPNLKYLDLSNNRLHGEVPRIFMLMPKLIYLNLSNNQLSGPLPSFLMNPVLSNPSFFANNPELCGGPLPFCPSDSKRYKLWEILGIVFICVIVSGGSCLLLGWIWRWRLDARQRKRDAELIAALLDRDTAAIMPLRDLKKATENFAETYRIGEGGFGTVFIGTLENGTSVAIKRNTREGTNEDKCKFLKEVKVLSQVQHRYLIRLLGCCLAHKISLLVFEFIPNGSLQEHLQRRSGKAILSWRQRVQIAVQAAEALDHLHSSVNPPIYHQDVKSANILLDEKLNAKVADFGISKLSPALDPNRRKGTLGYVDPEARKNSLPTGKSDVYGFGVVLLELLSARPAIDHTRYDGEASLAKRAITLLDGGRLEEIIDPALSETFQSIKGKESMVGVARIAAKCLNYDSKFRPLMKQVSKDLQSIWRFHYEPASLDDDDQFSTSVLELDVPWNFAGCAGASGTSFRSPG